MIEKPILFSGPMVRAIMKNLKSQTRRIVKGWPNAGTSEWQLLGFIDGVAAFRSAGERIEINAPYPVGTRLWVRETWVSTPDKQSLIWYAADGDFDGVRRPSIFMPRKFSRINLLVTGVRCQRLQDITEEDAIAEGSSLTDFPLLWSIINEKRGFPWHSNPWVWAYTFQRILK